MKIEQTKLPWSNTGKYGQRYNRDPFYQSQSWKNTRESFRLGYTLINGHKLLNIFCVDCYKERNNFTLGSHCDHITAIKDGGDRHDHSNLQTLCESCHNRKSAQEGNKRRKK